MSPLRMQRIQTLNELDGLKERWLALERRDGGPSIFQSWAWNRIWCEEVLPSRPRGCLDVRIIEDGAGRPLAILPLFTEAPAGPIVLLTQFLGHRTSFHNDVLLAEPQNAELAREVVRLLLGGLGPRTILHLRDLNEFSLFTQHLTAANSTEPQCPRVYLRADPALYDPLMRLGTRSRGTVRNHRNRLRRQFTVEFRRCSGDELPPAFDTLVALHHKRFSSQKRPSSLTGTTLAFFRHACAVVGEPGFFEITLLTVDGAAIAAELAAHDRGHYFSMIGGFDPDFAKFSPSYLLFLEVMRHGFTDLGCNIFDFGPGYEKYKYDWSPTVGTNYMCCRGGSGPYAKSLAALYRRAFRSRLPRVPNIQGRGVSSADNKPVDAPRAP